jgi:DNA-nicking Smr family endonuclease
MTKKERNRLRRLQDKVISKLERQGYQDDDIIDMHGVTLKDIKMYVYEWLEPEFKDFLSH